MSWKMRTALIVLAAVAIYAIAAFVMAGGLKKSEVAMVDRVASLEETVEALQAERPGRAGHRPGTLYALLASQPEAGNTLLVGWSQDQVVAELGWPDEIQGDRWNYFGRMPDKGTLQVVWTQAATVQAVVIASADKAGGKNN